MKVVKTALLLGIIAVTALAVFFANRPLRQPEATPPVPLSPKTAPASPPPAQEGILSPIPTAEAEADADADEPNGETDGAAFQRILEQIEELAITYDAASIPALAGFLTHPDARVREAAREGLVTLGEAAAIPHLKTAAQHAKADEAKLLEDAAEFLALPTITEFLKKD